MDNQSVNKNLQEMRDEYGNHGSWVNDLDHGYKWAPEEKISGVIEFFSGYHEFPTKRILEIAVGYGRISKELYKLCEEFYGIDLNKCCVDFCKKEIPEGNFLITDGTSIPYDKSIKFDLIVSYASMVHFDKDIIDLYLKDSLDRINKDGTIIFHHAANGVNKSKGNRSNMTAEMMKKFCNNYGLKIVDQVFWYPLENGIFNDCVSIIKN